MVGVVFTVGTAVGAVGVSGNIRGSDCMSPDGVVAELSGTSVAI